MAKLPVTIDTKNQSTPQTIRVEIDRDRFERLAALLGLYQPDFLKSLDRAEADIRAGRVKNLRSLTDFRSS